MQQRLLVGIFSLLLLALPLAGQSAEDKANIAGHIIAGSGKLLARSADGQERRLRRRSAVYPGDTILVGKNAFIQIRFTDGGLTSLRPDTEFKVSDYRYKEAESEEKIVFELVKGGLRTITGAVGKKSQEDYQLVTPVSTIGIRGTHYGLRMCFEECKDAAGNPIDPGLYGGVVDGRISVSNDSGEQIFGNDRYFHVSGLNAAPQELLGPPGFIFDHMIGQGLSRKLQSQPRTSPDQDQQPREIGPAMTDGEPAPPEDGHPVQGPGPQPEGEFIHEGEPGEFMPEGEFFVEGEFKPEGEFMPQGEHMPEGEFHPEGEFMPEGEHFVEGEFHPDNGFMPEGEFMPQGEHFVEGEFRPEGEFMPEGEFKPEGEFFMGGESGFEGEFLADGGFHPDDNYLPEGEFFIEDPFNPEGDYFIEGDFRPEGEYIADGEFMHDGEPILDGDPIYDGDPIMGDDPMHDDPLFPPDEDPIFDSPGIVIEIPADAELAPIPSVALLAGIPPGYEVLPGAEMVVNKGPEGDSEYFVATVDGHSNVPVYAAHYEFHPCTPCEVSSGEAVLNTDGLGPEGFTLLHDEKVYWGRWEGDWYGQDAIFTGIGQGSLHYIHSTNITPMEDMNNLHDLGVVADFTQWSPTDGTRPTDEMGNLGHYTVAPNMTVDFGHGKITHYEVGVGFNNTGREFYGSLEGGQPAYFEGPGGHVPLDVHCSGCSADTGKGMGNVVFVGAQASHAMTNFALTTDDHQHGAVGAALLTQTPLPGL